MIQDETTAATRTTGHERLLVLDGVRGLGALIVVFAHLVTLFRPALYSGTPKEALSRFDVPLSRTPFIIFWSGGLAVSVFLVHSGLVLARPYLVTRDPQMLWEMAARRIPRLAIPVAAAVLVVSPILMLGWTYNGPVGHITHAEIWMGKLYGHPASIGTVLRAATLGFIDPVGEQIIPPLWTMSVEVIGSFMVFGLVALSAGKRYHLWLFAGAIAWALYFSDRPYLAAMLAGAYLAHGDVQPFSGRPDPGRPVRRGRIVLLTLLIFYLTSVTLPPSAWHRPTLEFLRTFGVRPIDTCLIAAAVCVVLVIKESATLQRLFARREFQYLGKVSFSVYLLHTPVICSVGAWIFLKTYPDEGYWVAVGLASAASIVVSYALAHLFQRFVDAPGQRYARRLSMRTRPDPAPTVT